jgi:hypothetical protein
MREGLGLEHGRTATAAARLALKICRREEPVSSSLDGVFVFEARTTTPALRAARFCRNAAPFRRVKVTDDWTSAAIELGMSWEEVRPLFLDHRFYICDVASLERARTYLTRTSGRRARTVVRTTRSL